MTHAVLKELSRTNDQGVSEQSGDRDSPVQNSGLGLQAACKETIVKLIGTYFRRIRISRSM